MSILDKVQFFSAVDRKEKREGERIASEYPAFYFPTQLDELQEETGKLKRNIENNLIPPSELPYAKEELKRNLKRIDDIQNSRPKFTAREKDALGKLYQHLGSEIQDSMYSRSEMKKGLVNTHEEVRRMTEPIIDVGGEEGLFKNMGVNVVNGKVSRNQASRAWKIIGRVLGEDTNIEYLRKDFKHGTYHPERSLAEMERD